MSIDEQIMCISIKTKLLFTILSIPMCVTKLLCSKYTVNVSFANELIAPMQFILIFLKSRKKQKADKITKGLQYSHADFSVKNPILSFITAHAVSTATVTMITHKMVLVLIVYNWSSFCLMNAPVQ